MSAVYDDRHVNYGDEYATGAGVGATTRGDKARVWQRSQDNTSKYNHGSKNGQQC